MRSNYTKQLYRFLPSCMIIVTFWGNNVNAKAGIWDPVLCLHQEVGASVYVWTPEYSSEQQFLNCDPVPINLYLHHKEKYHKEF